MPDIKQKFQNLDAWKEAHELTLNVYRVSKKFPAEERYRLTDQLCRSASSVAANLVEGSARWHRKEFIQFAYLSKSSLEEAKYHLLLAKDLGYLDDKIYSTVINQANITGKLINGLINYLKTQKNEEK